MLVKLGSWFEMEVAHGSFFAKVMSLGMFIERGLGPLQRVDMYRAENGGLHLELVGLMFVFDRGIT